MVRNIGTSRRLGAVTDRLRRIRMHFDDYAIRADCDSRLGKRGNQAAFPCCMAGIEDDRKMSEFVQHSHGRDITSVASGRFEGANSAFAKNNVGIAVSDNVLR